MRKIWLYIILASLMVSLVGWHATAQQGIVIDGKMNDWQGIPPIIQESKKSISDVDIKAVYALIDRKNLYVMIEFLGDMDITKENQVNLCIDVDEDQLAEWESIFFINGSTRLYDFRNVSDTATLISSFLAEKDITSSVSVSVKDVAEFELPLSLIDYPKKFSIKIDIYFSGKKAKHLIETEYGKVIDYYSDWIDNVNDGIQSYKNGAAAFDSRDFSKAKEELIKAKEYFKKANELFPRKGLPNEASKINEYLFKIDKINQADTLFQEATNIFNSKDYKSAKIKFEASKKLYEEVGDSAKSSDCDVMLAKIENLLKTKQEADSAFNDAKNAFDAKEFQKARDLFIQAKNKYAQLEDTEKVTQCEDYIRQSEENMKKAGVEIPAVIIGLLLVIGYLRKK